MARKVKRIIRSRRGRPSKKGERNCRYLVVGGSGDDYTVDTYEEALQLADEVGGAAYLSCPVKSAKGLRWRRTRLEA